MVGIRGNLALRDDDSAEVMAGTLLNLEAGSRPFVWWNDVYIQDLVKASRLNGVFFFSRWGSMS